MEYTYIKQPATSQAGSKNLHVILFENKFKCSFFQETKYQHQITSELSNTTELLSACGDKVYTEMASAPTCNEVSIQHHKALHSLGTRGMPGAEQPLRLPG